MYNSFINSSIRPFLLFLFSNVHEDLWQTHALSYLILSWVGVVHGTFFLQASKIHSAIDNETINVGF